MKTKTRIMILLIASSYFLLFTYWGDVSNVWFSFCDNPDKDKIINIQAWWSTELCFNFYSRSSDKTQIQYWFSKWFIKNSNWLQLCDQDMSDDNDFSKLFSNSSWNNRTQIVPPQWFVTVHETIKAPLWVNWMVYGCLTFKAAKVNGAQAWWMFEVIERKSVHLNLLIWNTADIKSSIKLLPSQSPKIYSSNKNINIQSQKKTSISFLLKNNGNIAQEANIKWRFYNILWFEKNFQTEKYIIAPWTTIEIKKEIWIIPGYKWPFKVSFEIVSTPYIDFQWGNVDQSLKEPIVIQGTSQIFIFSRIWVVLLIIIVSIIVVTFKPLFKKA